MSGAAIQRFSEFELNLTTQELRRDGQLVPLGSRALELLVRFAASPGEVLTKDILARDVWGQAAVEDNTIAAQVAALRRALGPGNHIQTVTGRGYRFIADAASVGAGAASAAWPMRRVVLAGLAVLVLVGGGLALARFLIPPAAPPPWSEADDRGLIALQPLDLPGNDPALTAYGRAFAEALRARFTAQLGNQRLVPEEGLQTRSGLVKAPYRMVLTLRRDGDNADVSVRLSRRGSDETLAVFSAREPIAAGGDPHRRTVLMASAKVKAAVQGAEQARSRARPEARRDARDLVQLALVAKSSRATAPTTLAQLDRAYRLSPDQPQVLDAYASALANGAANGWSAHRDADLARALTLSERALALRPDDLNALHIQEVAYLAGGRWSDAVVAADRLLAAAPEISEVKLDKAFALTALGRDREAHQALEASLAVRLPELENYRAITAGLVRFREGDWAEAAVWFRDAVQTVPAGELSRPGFGGLLLYLAASEARAGHPAEARAAIGRFRAAAPQVKTFADFQAWDDPIVLPLVAPEAMRSALATAGF